MLKSGILLPASLPMPRKGESNELVGASRFAAEVERARTARELLRGMVRSSMREVCVREAIAACGGRRG